VITSLVPQGYGLVHIVMEYHFYSLQRGEVWAHKKDSTPPLCLLKCLYQSQES